MSITRYILWMIVVWLIAVALNRIHWRLGVTEKVLYPPSFGILAAVNAAILVAVVAVAILFLAGIIAPMPFVFLTFICLIAIEIFSVWIRHRQRRTRAEGEAWGIALVSEIWQHTWSPYQSPEVREICANLTPAEHARLFADLREGITDRWYWIAVRCAAELAGGFASVLAGGIVFSWQLGVALLTLFAAYCAVVVWPRLRAMRRRSIESLCDTEWARHHGYTPDRLKLMKFPFGRKRDRSD